MKLKVKQGRVRVGRGDITDWGVGAIVNGGNATRAMGTGVAAAIKRKGGVSIEEDAMRQGPIEVGEAVVSTASPTSIGPWRMASSSMLTPPLRLIAAATPVPIARVALPPLTIAPTPQSVMSPRPTRTRPCLTLSFIGATHPHRVRGP